MNRIQRNQGEKKKLRRKLVIVNTTIIAALTLSCTIAFAEVDINGLLTSWYNKKVESAKIIIQKSVMSEAENQKVRLKEALAEKMKASEEELDKYTAQEKESRTEAIRKYADELINNSNFSNEKDKKKISNDLDSIVNEAKKAMDAAIKDYKK